MDRHGGIFDYLGTATILSPAARLSDSLGLGQLGSLALSALLLAYLFWEWKGTFGGDEQRFLWTAALTQSVVLLVVPFGIVSNLVLLVFPLALILAVWYARQGRSLDAPATLVLLLLAAASWLLSLRGLEQGVPSVWVLSGAPLLTIGGLLWVRWWSTRARTWAEIGARWA